MICVVYLPTRAKGSPPCVAQYTRRVSFHVGVRTWCNKEVDASTGVFQVPDAMKVCEECADAVKAYEANLGEGKTG